MNQIAIIGSPDCYSKEVKDIFYKLYKQYATNVIIASGGNKTGVEYDVKKIALESNYRYKEYNPFHTPYTNYSVLTEEKYGKRWHPTHDIGRYMRLVRESDAIIILSDGDKLIEQVEKYAYKQKKPVVKIEVFN